MSDLHYTACMKVIDHGQKTSICRQRFGHAGPCDPPACGTKVVLGSGAGAVYRCQLDEGHEGVHKP